MSINVRQNATMTNYLLGQQRLVFEVAITANATPALKVLQSDIPGVAVLRAQGQTAAADAIESGIAFTAPNDANGIFGVLVDDLSRKFLKAEITPSVGTATVTKALSAEGRPFLNIDSNQDLSTTNLTVLVELEYQIEL